jgi:hypothetical protein
LSRATEISRSCIVGAWVPSWDPRCVGNVLVYVEPEERPWGTEITVPWSTLVGAPDQVTMRIEFWDYGAAGGSSYSVTYQELRLPPGLLARADQK